MTFRFAPVLGILFVIGSVSLLPGSAEADGAYLELQVGPSFFADSDLSNGGTAELSFDTGFNVGGAAGARFMDIVRAELGLHYRNADTDEIRVPLLGSGSVSGDVGVFTAMANGYLDLDFWDVPVVPYVGAGIGAGVVFADFAGVDDEDSVFAYNVMGGVAYELTDHWVGRAGYRYLGTTDPKIQGVEAEVDIHELVFGLRYEF